MATLEYGAGSAITLNDRTAGRLFASARDLAISGRTAVLPISEGRNGRVTYLLVGVGIPLRVEARGVEFPEAYNEELAELDKHPLIVGTPLPVPDPLERATDGPHRAIKAEEAADRAEELATDRRPSIV